MAYFSIYIPSKVDDDNDEPFVFSEKEEALKVLKNHKNARLKIFKSNEEALYYAQTGNEVIIAKFNDLKSPSSLPQEKLKYHAPTKQELVKFRKAIEENNYDLVESLIWNNPRYLVNSGDTPTSLKEGPRYNALHVCALNKRAVIAKLILDTITDTEFTADLHGRAEDDKMNQEVCDVLLDYYLNMPEKGRNETPLHLAVKNGADEVVEVLTSYPQCKMQPNIDNLLPKDIVCSRVSNPPAELVNKIQNLLQEGFYVPVIRSVDNSTPPVIGEPFSPTNPPNLNQDPMSPELKIQAYAGPIRSKEEAQKFRRRWKTPPRNGNSPLANSPIISPLKLLNSSTPTKSSINKFNNNNNSNMNLMNNSIKKKLKMEDSQNGNINDDSDEIKFKSPTTSQQYTASCNNNIITPTTIGDVNTFSTLTPLIKNPKKRDLFFTYREKAASPVIFGDEMSYFGGDAATGMNNDTSLNLDTSTTTGFIGRMPLSSSLLSNHQPTFESPGLHERHLKLIDTEKGVETIGRELAKEHNIGWKEHWDFLNSFVDISSQEGLIKLEAYLKKRTEDCHFEKLVKQFKTRTTKLQDESPVSCLFDLSTRSSSQNSPINKQTSNNISNGNGLQYLYVEKSLQVFANRMTKTIINNIDSVVQINDVFITELKRLKSLICSFRDDVRFLNINVKVIHSRFANLIVTLLRNTPGIDSNSFLKIKKCFEQINQSTKKEKLHCLSTMILDYLENPSTSEIQLESIKTEEICSEIWGEELTCNCSWNWEANRHEHSWKRRLARRYHSDKVEKSSDEIRTQIQTSQNNTEKSTENLINLNQSNITEDNDDDCLWFDVESDNDNHNNVSDEDNSESEDVFYTPPESPTQLKIDDNYDVFLLSNEPTKRDWDVIKALHNIEIDKEKYPSIYLWKAAVLRYSIEECESFPSPTSVVRRKLESRLLLQSDAKRRLFSFSDHSSNSKLAETLSSVSTEAASAMERRRLFEFSFPSPVYVTKKKSEYSSLTSGAETSKEENTASISNPISVSFQNQQQHDGKTKSDFSINLSLLNISDVA